MISQKEKGLLEDLKTQEQLCVEKYAKHAQAAHDPQLSQLFQQIGQAEQQHLDTVTQMLSGSVPSTNGGQSKNQPTFTAAYGPGTGDSAKQEDAYLCQDLLATEKHVSSVYDTCVFEFKDENARKALNHIQAEEQQHGKSLYDYMNTNGMYS